MELSDEQFERLKESVRSTYDAQVSIRCPFFMEDVVFSSDGFKHMLFKGSQNKTGRTRIERINRLKLFKLAPKLLRITKTVQEEHTKKEFIPVEHNHRKELQAKEVTYWGFIAIIDGHKIKVIVKQIGAGSKRFWSIIPNWTTRKSREANSSYVNYTGDMEND